VGTHHSTNLTMVIISQADRFHPTLTC